MKIWNFRIEWHKHKWEKKILDIYPSGMLLDGHTLKVGEECVAKNCNYDGYRSVYYIMCKNRPEAYRVS